MTWTPLQLWIFDELNRTLGPARAVPAPPVVDLESMLLSLVTLAAARLPQFVDLQRCTRSVLI